MKKIIIALLLVNCFMYSADAKTQDKKIRETVSYINKLLKENPYRDEFQEITFFYSIDVTSNKELVVKLENDGPFVTSFIIKLSDLNPQLQSNPGMIASTHLCWNCKSKEGKQDNNCVINETIYTGGDKEVHTSGQICVMFSNKNKIYDEVRKSFEKLFRECGVK